jgi:hypothetical protein
MIMGIEATCTPPFIFLFPRKEESEVICISSSSYEGGFEVVVLSHRFAYLQRTSKLESKCNSSLQR